MEVQKPSENIVKRTKHSKRHANADTTRSITDGWRDALFRDRQEEICSIGDFYHELGQLRKPLHESVNVTMDYWYSLKSALTSTRPLRNRALITSRCARNFKKQRTLSQWTESTMSLISLSFSSDNMDSDCSSRSSDKTDERHIGVMTNPPRRRRTRKRPQF